MLSLFSAKKFLFGMAYIDCFSIYLSFLQRLVLYSNPKGFILCLHAAT